MFESLFEIISGINGVLWGPWSFILLVLSGLLFTVWTKFTQYRALTHGIQVVRGIYDDPEDKGAINHFQALSAALSATVGLGNIGGVALAIGLGGPGSLFWMWVIGFLGMALKTVEITLSMMYRNIDDPDNPSGGAMWVIDQTLGKKGGAFKTLAKIIGGIFCTTLLISTMTGGNMFQSWNVADLTNLYFGVPQLVTGAVMAVLVGAVIIGGIKRIGSVAGKLVPLMCVLYIAAAIAVLFLNASEIPSMLSLIVSSAFSDTAGTGAFLGGSVGFAFTVGVKRALFSNEAGQGSAPIAHSAAKTNEPAREGVVGGIGPFIDTILICTLTALVILSTGTWDRSPQGMMKGTVELSADGLVAPTDVSALPALDDWEKWQPGSQVFFLIEAPDEDDKDTMVRQKIMGRIKSTDSSAIIEWGEMPKGAIWTTDKEGAPEKRIFRDFKGATLTSHAFDVAFPGLGKWLVTLAAWLFAISTMISWSYYGEQGVLFLMGKKAIIPYKFIFCLGTIIAPIVVTTDSQLGELADFGTGWMLWANMPIVLALGYLAVRCNNDYFKRLKAGEFKKNTSKKA